MDAEQIIADMTARIVHRFDPVEVILFGSRARGDRRPDSDVDLIVVLDEIADRRERRVAVMRELNHSRLPKDVIVATPAEVANAPFTYGTALRTGLREGRWLYRRAG
jgi:predicted nucleotidyltransferase